MTIYDVCLFLVMSPMVWLPIYQICEFVHRQGNTSPDLKIHPILEEEASGIMVGAGIGDDEPAAATHESPAAAAAAAVVAPSDVGAHGVVVKLTVSDKIPSGEGGNGNSAGDGSDGCQSDGNEDGNEAQEIQADGLIAAAQGVGGGAGDELIEMEEGFV
jgi:hypothetical protein